MPDNFASHTSSLNSPAAGAADITPADGVALAQATRAIYVGQGGDLRIRTVSGDVVTLAGTANGAVYPLRASEVFATGTTAASLVALF